MMQLCEQFFLVLLKVTAFVLQLWHTLKMVVQMSLSLHSFYKIILAIFTEFIVTHRMVCKKRTIKSIKFRGRKKPHMKHPL